MTAGWTSVAAELLEAGVFGRLELHAVPRLARVAGEGSVSVQLAAGLAMGATRHGHVCVDLLTVDLGRLCHADADPTALAALLPSDREAWVRELAGSPLVASAALAAKAASTGEGSRPFVLAGGALYLCRWWLYEHELGSAVWARCIEPADPVPAELDEALNMLFAGATERPDRQRLAARLASSSRFTVITGGPGTGKTFTVRNLLAALYLVGSQGAGPPRVRLAAPTGKAAARLGESLLGELSGWLTDRGGPAVASLGPGAPQALSDWLTGLAPTTLHRLLGVRPGVPESARFNAERPLAADVVIVDEASMIDMALMSQLLKALRPQARLVLLGDEHQLASVEAGSVLADLCAVGPQSPVSDAVARLVTSRRFHAGSGIGRCARACVGEDASADALLAVLNDRSAPDAAWLRPSAGRPPKALAELVRGVFVPLRDKARAGPAAAVEGRDAWASALLGDLGELRLLCAHREGPLGVSGLNAWVARLLDLGELARRLDAPLEAGVPVMVRQNDRQLQLANGDVGLAVFDGARLQVAFSVEGGVLWVPPARLPRHEVVFANTIHKSQGSEYKHAVVVLPSTPSAVVSRELVYTGLTRAKEQLTLVATEASLRAALGLSVQRASGLSRMLGTGRLG